MNKAMVPCEYDVPHAGLEFLDYYPKHNVYHPGIDLNKGYGNDDLGNKIVCPVDGVVDYVSPAPTWRNGQNGGLGKFFLIYHAAYGKWTRYIHCNEVKVKADAYVKVGQDIATVGNTGTTWAHLHLEVFDEIVYNICKNHWRKFAWYASGKSKAWVSEHYENPLKWIDGINKENEAQKEDEPIVKWHKENKIIEKWSKPPTPDEIKMGWAIYKGLDVYNKGNLKFNL